MFSYKGSVPGYTMLETIFEDPQKRLLNYVDDFSLFEKLCKIRLNILKVFTFPFRSLSSYFLVFVFWF